MRKPLIYLRIVWHLIRCMPALAFHDLFRPARRDAFFRKIYLDWAAWMLELFEADIGVEGGEYFRPGGGRPWVVLCNHQSQLDIPALLTAMRTPLTFVAKRELSRVPLLSYWMRKIGCIFIDRRNRGEARRTLERQAGRLRDKPLVIFPEGTRSRSGELLPFKPGSGRAAILTGARVLPVRIQGSRDAWENRRAFGRRVTVKVRFFPPLDARGMEDSRVCLDRIRDYVERCWRAEGSGLPGLEGAAEAVASGRE